MNILTFSSEKLDLLNNDIKSLTEEKSTLEAASVEKLWMNDLNELEQEYVNKCLKVDGEESKQGSFYDRSRFEAEDDEEDEPVIMPASEHRKVVSGPLGSVPNIINGAPSNGRTVVNVDSSGY